MPTLPTGFKNLMKVEDKTALGSKTKSKTLKSKKVNSSKSIGSKQFDKKEENIKGKTKND